jgi:hypothetical protein
MSKKQKIVIGTLVVLLIIIGSVFFYLRNAEKKSSHASDEPYIPVSVSLSELRIAPGEEKSIVADHIVVSTIAEIKGTLTLQLPPNSTTGTIHVELPENSLIEGSVIVKKREADVATVGFFEKIKDHIIPPVRAVIYAPPVSETNLLVEAIPPLRISDQSSFETPSGEAASDEVIYQLGIPYFRGSRGGSGGDIFILTPGNVVFEVSDTSAPGIFTMFKPGNGGRGANVILNDGTWNNEAVRASSFFGGQGGRSGGLFIDAGSIRIVTPAGVSPEKPIFMGIAGESGRGGDGGSVVWDVNEPELRSAEEFRVGGGMGGSGLYVGGNGGLARYAAGKPIVHKDAPHPVTVVVVGGEGGGIAEYTKLGPTAEYEEGTEVFFKVPSVIEPEPVLLSADAGHGGSVTVVGHDGLPGTKDHPNGYEPGPIVVRYGDGGGVTADTAQHIIRGGNGAGAQANVTSIVGGDGGDGFSFCDPDEEKQGGDGGRSGHLTIYAGEGGDGSQRKAGGRSGNLDYDLITMGKPGKAGNGKPPGTPGFFGLPENALFAPGVLSSINATEDHEGIRLVGRKGGANGLDTNDVLEKGIERKADTVFGSTYVQPDRIDGETCGNSMTILPLNPEGIYRQSVTVVYKRLFPIDNPNTPNVNEDQRFTTTETVEFTKHMNCPPPSGGGLLLSRFGRRSLHRDDSEQRWFEIDLWKDKPEWWFRTIS